MSNLESIVIYTDGACRGNPGIGGYGSILTYNGHEKRISGYCSSTTNNRMEITAVIEAIKCVNRPCHITIYTDSRYVVDAIEKGWLDNWMANGWKNSSGKPTKNIDLWKELRQLMEIHEVEFVWVKGHAGHYYNEECDRMANVEMDKRS